MTKQTFLIIGSGRLAQHLGHYLGLLDLPILNWSRQKHSKAELSQMVTQSDRILLCISDDAIADFIKDHDFLGKPLIHFSGSMSFPKAKSAHPLMSFSNDLYDLDTYKDMPFILDQENLILTDLLPGLPNPYFHIRPEQKALYHALCVSSGNFTSLLWKEVKNRFSEKLGLPTEVLDPYLSQISKNIVKDSEAAMTGPLVRGDKKVIAKNLEALKGDPLQEIYKSFLDYFDSTKV